MNQYFDRDSRDTGTHMISYFSCGVIVSKLFLRLSKRLCADFVCDFTQSVADLAEKRNNDKSNKL